MILRKPYAFFIKMFKPINIFMAIMTGYLIFLENKILSFFNTYISSDINVVGQSLRETLANNFIYIIPIMLIVFSLLILGIMFKKNKNFKFYIVTILAFIIVLVINIYAVSFLGVLEESIVSIKSVKLIHDFIVINMGIEVITFIMLVVRGMGVNFKKFDFDSDISKFDISENDKEEFEVSINVDLNEVRRKRKEKIRKLKYFYLENKFLINVSVICLVVIVVIISLLIFLKSNKKYKEGNVYSAANFNFGVEETLVLNTDYQGKKITDNYLIVVNTKMSSNFSDSFIIKKDFSLKIGDVIFKPITKYSNSLVDLGIVYNNQTLSSDNNNYLFIYEISEKYIESEMIFSYINQGNSIDIYLNPQKLVTNEMVVNKNINEEISFEKSLGNIKLKINNFEIKDKFLIEYNYCIKENDCILSKEYLKPSINENFHKCILRLNVDYKDNSNLKLNSFYDFFEKFAHIYYQIDGEWYYQNDNFEEINSNKMTPGNNIYIGINSDVINATSIKLVFNVRGSRYEYLLK